MDLQYVVKRSPRRRTVTLTVERDRQVVVRAPENATDAQIDKIVQSRRGWIFEKLKDSKKYNATDAPGKELVNGESALYLGRSYQIALTECDAVHFNRRFHIPARLKAQRGDVLRDWYKAKAKEKILPRVAYHAREMGVEYGQAKIVESRYRWGSCTVNNNVTFNWRLIKAPMFVIDYVITHELAHLIEGNHTARFWNIVRTHSPKMEKAREWLCENGQTLEEGL